MGAKNRGTDFHSVTERLTAKRVTCSRPLISALSPELPLTLAHASRGEDVNRWNRLPRSNVKLSNTGIVHTTRVDECAESTTKVALVVL